MVTASPRISSFVDLLVFDPEGFPVLAVEVRGSQGHREDAKQQLRRYAMPLGIPYGLVVDTDTAEFVDLGDPATPSLFVIPTRALLVAYAHDMDAREVTGRYLTLLVDSWLRNIMQPLPTEPPPGFSQLTTLGLAAKLHEGSTVREARMSF